MLFLLYFKYILKIHFLNFFIAFNTIKIKYKLKIEHSSHEYTPALQLHLLDILVNGEYTSNFRFLVKSLDGQIDLPNLLSQIQFKVSVHFLRHSFVFLFSISSTIYGQNEPPLYVFSKFLFPPSRSCKG